MYQSGEYYWISLIDAKRHQHCQWNIAQAFETKDSDFIFEMPTDSVRLSEIKLYYPRSKISHIKKPN